MSKEIIVEALNSRIGTLRYIRDLLLLELFPESVPLSRGLRMAKYNLAEKRMRECEDIAVSNIIRHGKD